MLYIGRKEGESIVINDGICIKVMEVKGKVAKLGIEYPQGTQIYRGELYERIQAENKAALADIKLIKGL